jgi:signal transduction histidine kinase
LELSAPDGPVLVEGNRDALRHALVHILITVIEGTAAGDKVGIQVAAAEGGATIGISGTGEMPPEILGGLEADPRRQAALGAERGMYIARRVVERHGGSIHVRKGARSASILEIQLPLAAAENE